MAETEQRPAEPDHLEAGERAYFESRGEKDIPTAAAPELPLEKPEASKSETPPADAPKPPVDAPKPPEPSATVPQQALHDERKRRQEAEERARQMELLNARMEERFRAFHAATTQQQRPAPVPTPDQDIFGAVKHMQVEQQRTRAEIDGYKRQIQQEDYVKQLTNWGRNAEVQFVSQNSDYYRALEHMRLSRGRQLRIWGMGGQPIPNSNGMWTGAIGDQLKHEENQLLARAAAERVNPAEKAYLLAHELGYRKDAQPQPQPNVRHEVDLNRIEAGQRQASSLSNIGGGGGRDVGDIEIEDLLKMGDKEFGDFIVKYPGKFRRLKGASH